jgi:hypothetical protein
VIGEEADYDKVIAIYRSVLLLEHDRGRIAINPDRFDKLITALRTAVDNDGTRDKEATSYNDIFDAFRLAKFYHFKDSSDYDYSIQIPYIAQI